MSNRMRLALLALLFLAMAVVRIAGPDDLFRGDQEKQVGYVMDILRNGNWATQYEVTGKIATKPPFYNWCAAALCMATGSTSPVMMRLPGLFAGAGLAVVVYLLGRRLLDAEAAFWATVALLTSHHVVKLMWFARTDMLMTALLYGAIGLTLLPRARWWRSLAVGTVLGVSFLTKGPVAPALYAIWLVLWAAATGRLRDRKGWPHLLVGAAVLTVFAVCWLRIVWDMPGFRGTVVEGELGSRFAAGGHRAKPPWYYVPLIVGRIAPWSLLAVAGAWLCWRRPTERWVRPIVWWAACFFLFFSLLPSKRHDLLLPVYPPVMLLAGLGMREALRLASPRWLLRVACGTAAALVAAALVLAAKEGRGPYWLVAALAGAAGVATLLYARGGRWQSAFLASATALVLVIGLESWEMDDETRGYVNLRVLLQPMQEAAREGRVVVIDAHPLVSYVLGLHDHHPSLPASGDEEVWLLSGKELPTGFLETTAWVPDSVTHGQPDELNDTEIHIWRLLPRKPGI